MNHAEGDACSFIYTVYLLFQAATLPLFAALHAASKSLIPDLNPAPYFLYGGEYIDPVSLVWG